uniref:Uncharacterized protein n=1 Tax=Ceratitis capitata TaxID=7213 RepID=W8BJL0_CERCA
MRTVVIIIFAVFSFMLFHNTAALPLDDSDSGSDEVIVIAQSEVNPADVQGKDRDILIDVALQSSAHIEVPESVAKDLIKTMFQAFKEMKTNGDVKVSVSVPEEQPAMEVGEPQSR